MDRIEQVILEEKDKNFEHYRRYLRSGVRRQAKEGYLVQAYANAAELEAYKAHKMGKELNKLQQRIGRQRTANNKMRRKIEELNAAIDRSYEQRELERISYEKELDELRRELAAEREARRNWSASRLAEHVHRESGFRPWNQESSTSPGFDSTTEHGTGEAPADGP